MLDTNVVLSALVFGKGRLAALRDSWQRHACVPLVSKPTVTELLRVLAYPKFRLTAPEQAQLLEEFLPWAEVVTLPEPWPVLPACRDPKDQVFLVLAHVARADALVTGDADLLALSDAFGLPILTVEQWAAQQAAG
ncbi:MAG: putative toxin-antitoxin system toxin component, PIN family [Pseudorhodoferax sp.]